MPAGGAKKLKGGARIGTPKFKGEKGAYGRGAKQEEGGKEKSWNREKFRDEKDYFWRSRVVMGWAAEQNIRAAETSASGWRRWGDVDYF